MCEAVQAKIKRVWQVEELGEHGGDRSGEQVGITNLKSSDNTATYAEARLRRDRPDLYERVVEGEMSATPA